MRCAHEAGFVERGCQVHAAVKHGVEKGVEARLVGGQHGVVVLGQGARKEKAEHAALAVAHQRDAGVARAVA